MPETILANRNDLNKYIESSKNCVSSNVDGGCLMKSKNSSVLLNFTSVAGCGRVVLTFKKLSGNGLVLIICNGFSKKYIINNTQKIYLPFSDKINISRDKDSTGDISFVCISGVFVAEPPRENIQPTNLNKKLYINASRADVDSQEPQIINDEKSNYNLPTVYKQEEEKSKNDLFRIAAASGIAPIGSTAASLKSINVTKQVQRLHIKPTPLTPSKAIELARKKSFIKELTIEDIHELLDVVSGVTIYCPGKIGEIFAATSIAKYIKTKSPKTPITWVCVTKYKPILEMIPYVDIIETFGSPKCDVITAKRESVTLVEQLNKKYCSAWCENNILYFNPYFNYLYFNGTYDINNKPFNEQFFDCLSTPYTATYQPDIKNDPELEAEADQYHKQFGNFVFIFKYGHDIAPLSFTNIALKQFAQKLKERGITTVLNGSTMDKAINVENCVNFFGSNIKTTFHLLKRAKAVIGVNSGIVFSALFLRCPMIVMEDLRQIPMWNVNNIKTDYYPRLMSEKRLNARAVASFIINNL